MTDPRTERLADGIHRIPLPLPLDDLTSINAYALESAAGLILIDPGWASTGTTRSLTEAVRELGYSMSDVTIMIATHGHWDHYTQAVAIRDEHRGKVHLGWEEHHSIDAFTTLAGCYPRQVELLRAAGAPDLADRIDALVFQEHEIDLPFGNPDVWLHGGDVLDLGDRTLSIHAMPGHTRGHMVVADEAAGVMFTGDHILPRITPSIGFEREPESMPLRSFLSSLRATLDLPDARMLPAHGPVSPSVHARARDLIAHHAERLALIRQIGEAGRSPYEIARSLAWTRHERRLDELTPVHQMTAILEVAAHLAYDGDLTEPEPAESN